MPEVAHKALGSRKAWAALLGALLMVFREWLGLSCQDVQEVLKLFGLYIVGQGVVDASATFKKESSNG